MKANINKSKQSIHQGDCVRLINDKRLFQVLGIDDLHQRCWVRDWPMVKNGSPVYEISMKQIVISTN